MGLPWIAVHKDWLNHPKAVELCDLSGDDCAALRWIAVWLWVGQYYPSGTVTGNNPIRQIERAAMWEGKTGMLVDSAIRVGLIDDANGLSIHDWEDYQGAHARRAESSAKRSKLARERNANAPRTPDERTPNAHRTPFERTANAPQTHDERRERTGEDNTTASQSDADAPNADTADASNAPPTESDESAGQETARMPAKRARMPASARSEPGEGLGSHDQQPPPSKPAGVRRPSAARAFVDKLMRERTARMPSAAPDVMPKAAMINARVGELVRAHGEPALEAAYRAFLQDPYWLAKAPPCPIGAFLAASQVGKYLAAGAKATQASSGGPRPWAEICAEVGADPRVVGDYEQKCMELQDKRDAEAEARRGVAP